MIMINELDSVIDFLNKKNKSLFIELLCIEFIYVDMQCLIAKMPINLNMYQFDGIMHGGYSLILAETVSSSFSFIHIDYKKYQTLCMHVSLNHLKSIKNGFLYAKAFFIKKGFYIHIIKVKLYNENNDIIAFSIITNFIKNKLVI